LDVFAVAVQLATANSGGTVVTCSWQCRSNIIFVTDLDCIVDSLWSQNCQ